ncbi:MAG: hypothetical protein QM497_01850 [Sulfurimonas sp.]
MLNIIDLEKRWIRYKIKSYIPHAIIVVSLVILSVLASIILNLQNGEEEVLTKKITLKEPVIKIAPTSKKTEQNTIVTPKAQIQKEVIATVVEKSTTTKLQPSLNFIKELQNSSLPYYQPNTYKKTKPKTIKKAKKKIITQTIIIEEATIKKEKNIQKEPEIIKTERIIINRKETRDDIDNVIKRFKVNNNPALSLFVAKKYYAIGNYHQSYNYALITNQINKDIESSWIIFAKSLVKLGKKDKAINTLKEYIKISDSHTARLLKEEIQSGSFR